MLRDLAIASTETAEQLVDHQARRPAGPLVDRKDSRRPANAAASSEQLGDSSASLRHRPLVVPGVDDLHGEGIDSESKRCKKRVVGFSRGQHLGRQ